MTLDDQMNVDACDSGSKQSIDCQLLCRTCGLNLEEDSKNFINLFEEATKNQLINANIYQLFDLLDLNITEKDELPQNICESCFKTFSDFDGFYRNCLQIQSNLSTLDFSSSDEDGDEKDAKTSSSSQSTEKSSEITGNVEKPPDEPSEKIFYDAQELIDDLKRHATSEDDIIDLDSNFDINDTDMTYDDSNFEYFVKTEIEDLTESIKEEIVTVSDETKDDQITSPNESESIVVKSEADTTDSISLSSTEPIKATSKGPPERLCRHCNGTFTKIRLHKKFCSKNTVKVCKYCEEKFKNEINLEKHIQERHGHDNEQYFCKQCKRGFRSLYYLSAHKQKIHKNILPCPICGKECLTKIRYRSHMKSHGNADKFHCPDCGKLFISELDKTKHRCNSAKKENLTCSPDAQMVSDESSKELPPPPPDTTEPPAEIQPSIAPLKTASAKRETPTEYTCRICSLKFKTAQSLGGHSQIHRRRKSKKVGIFTMRKEIRKSK